MGRRRVGLAVLLATAAAAGCENDPPPAELPVVTPPASAAPATSSPGPAATVPSGTVPPATVPAPTSAGPTGTAAPPLPADNLIAYRELRADWQQARSRFFAAVSDGRPRTIAQQRVLAAGYLTGLRRFGTGVRTASAAWPAATRPAVRELLAANAAQQARVATMTRAPGPSAFTERLADYGVGAARENRAVDGVERALGG